MKGYLTDLVARSLHPDLAVQPRLGSFFEPTHVLGRRPFTSLTEIEDNPTNESTPPPNIGRKQPFPEISSQVRGRATALETKLQEHPGIDSADETVPAPASDWRVGSPGRMPQEGASMAPRNAADSRDQTSSLEPTTTGVSAKAPPALPGKEPKAYAVTPSKLDTQFEGPIVEQPRLGNETQLLANPSPQPGSFRPDRAADETRPKPSYSELRSLRKAPPHLSRLEPAPIVVEPNVTPLTESTIPVGPSGSASRISPNIVRVHIGRVEVRAIMPPAPPPPAPVRQVPLVSLDEYLKRRNGERS